MSEENVVIIMSGGVGARFGATIPKQYNLIAGRPVIDYVIDAVERSQKTDKVVVVMDSQWLPYSLKLKQAGFVFAKNGDTRQQSMLNGLTVIKERYDCRKVVIVDAVVPFLFPELIDDYFDKLDTYDAVITSQRITGGLTDIYNNNLDRDDYIVTQSPEGFRFELLWDNYKLNFPYQETAGMLPAGSKRYYHYDFKNNLKLTYDFELIYAEYMLQSMGRIAPEKRVYFDKELLLTSGLQEYLYRNDQEAVSDWIASVYACMPDLIERWKITSFLPNQRSRFGLVLQADSQVYGKVIMKFIPAFVGRYEREKESMEVLSRNMMCELLDAVDKYHCMLLKRISPATYGKLDETGRLEEFYKRVIDSAVPLESSLEVQHIRNYCDELTEKWREESAIPYLRKEVCQALLDAISLYHNTFDTEQHYVIHGDLHASNILDDGKHCWAIDPCGYVAPLEFECVRFILNDVRSTAVESRSQRFDFLITWFGQFVDPVKLAKACIIDGAFIAFNSTFEHETPEETWFILENIRCATEWLELRNIRIE